MIVSKRRFCAKCGAVFTFKKSKTIVCGCCTSKHVAEINKMEKQNSSANDNQIGGKHYQTEIQPWDFVSANNLCFFVGNIVKYVTRYKSKNGVEDLKKARHYLDKLIEIETAKESGNVKSN